MNAFLQAKPDTNYSTYRHIIRFVGRNPKIGYSKKQNFNEKEDKRLLLADILGRLVLKNFEEGAWEFEVVRRTWKSEQLQASEEKLVSIYPDGYELFGKYKFDNILAAYLDILLSTKDNKKALTVFQGYSALSFVGNTFEDLKNECSIMKLYYPYDRVFRLYDAVCRKYKWGTYAEVAAAPTMTVAINLPKEEKRGGDAVSLAGILGKIFENQLPV